MNVQKGKERDIADSVVPPTHSSLSPYTEKLTFHSHKGENILLDILLFSFFLCCD